MKASVQDPDPAALAQSILDYLGAHPDAADNLEGIASWWLPQSSRSETLEAVQEALSRLVAEERIACIGLPDGRTLYQSAAKGSGSHPTGTSSPRKHP